MHNEAKMEMTHNQLAFVFQALIHGTCLRFIRDSWFQQLASLSPGCGLNVMELDKRARECCLCSMTVGVYQPMEQARIGVTIAPQTLPRSFVPLFSETYRRALLQKNDNILIKTPKSGGAE